MADAKVLLGEIGRPHGVRGLVRVRSFTAEPEDLTAYGPLTDESGTRRYALELLSADLAKIDGVADRDAAARLTGTKLYVPREASAARPRIRTSFISPIWKGCPPSPRPARRWVVFAPSRITGQGPFLVLEGPPERLVPFTRAAVPAVDLRAGRITVVPPAEIVVDEQEGAA
jgi:16S rRNA processing protein RimM